jgi:hypothetical protein
MEGFGVKKIMETLKYYDLNVTQVVHDKDASTMRQVMDVFEDVDEGLCLCNFLFIFLYFSAHGCKNLKKQIFKLSKTHLEFKFFASRAMGRLIKLSMSDGTHFKTMVEDKLNHYCGYHDKCPDRAVCDKFVHIKDSEARKAFMVCYLFYLYILIIIECLVFICRTVLKVQDG